MQSQPKVLIIGHSISIGYFQFVQKALKGTAIVSHNEGNVQSTELGLENVRHWIGDTPWDLIQFNWGLGDIADKTIWNIRSGQPDVPLVQYQTNLDPLIVILKRTGARLIFVTISYVPPKQKIRLLQNLTDY